jgi:predicted small integral membrane protein
MISAKALIPVFFGFIALALFSAIASNDYIPAGEFRTHTAEIISAKLSRVYVDDVESHYVASDYKRYVVLTLRLSPSYLEIRAYFEELAWSNYLSGAAWAAVLLSVLLYCFKRACLRLYFSA